MSDTPVVNPASPAMIWWMGFFSFLLAVILFYLLITTWPVPFGATAFRPVNILGWTHYWAPDRHMMVTVMIAGAIGGLTHTMKSFGDYVGNRELSANWIWFLILRLPVGTAIALFFYFVIRGGVLIPTIQSQPQLAFSTEPTLMINPYAMAGFAALAGMFSKQATDKLAAVFDALFAMKHPVQRDDQLGSKTAPTPPVISTIDPNQLDSTSRSLTIDGQGFQAGLTATINGEDRTPTSVEDKKTVIPLAAPDVAIPGDLKLAIKNPDGGSVEATIKVVKAP